MFWIINNLFILGKKGLSAKIGCPTFFQGDFFVSRILFKLLHFTFILRFILWIYFNYFIFSSLVTERFCVGGERRWNDILCIVNDCGLSRVSSGKYTNKYTVIVMTFLESLLIVGFLKCSTHVFFALPFYCWLDIHYYWN